VSYQWFYLGFTHNSKDKNGLFYILSGETKLKKKFKTDYTYELRQLFKIHYGAYSSEYKDVSVGMIGDIGPFFYASYYYENIDRYWMGSYYNGDLLTKHYMRLEYVFDDYTNVNSVHELLGGEDGKIVGDSVMYKGKKGLTISGGETQIEIKGKISTIVKGVRTLCFFFAFYFEEPLTDKFILMSRGPLGKPHSLTIYLVKTKGKRSIMVEVGYLTKDKSPKTLKFSDERKVNDVSFNELEVCLATGPDAISSTMIYLNGKTNFMDVTQHYTFEFDKYQDQGIILSKEAKFKGSITLNAFYIVEGGGGTIISQETQPEVKISLNISL